MKTKAIIFDFNGTLFLDDNFHELAWNEFSLKYRQKPISDVELKNLIGRHNIDILRMIIPNLSDDQIKPFSKEKEELYRSICLKQTETIQLAPNAINLFEYCLNHDIPINICSSSNKANIDFYFKHFNLAKYFDSNLIVYDNDTYSNKEPMYIQAAKNLNLAIADCTIIEDSLSGLQGGYDAGCRNIIYLQANPHKNYPPFPNASCIVSNFNEVSAYLFPKK